MSPTDPGGVESSGGVEQRLEEKERVLASFASRLDAYAESLSPKERRLLDVVIYRAMSPLDRIRTRGNAGLLTPDEERLLEELAGEDEDRFR